MRMVAILSRGRAGAELPRPWWSGGVVGVDAVQGVRDPLARLGGGAVREVRLDLSHLGLNLGYDARAVHRVEGALQVPTGGVGVAVAVGVRGLGETLGGVGLGVHGVPPGR